MYCPMPEHKTDRYLFPLKSQNDENDTDIDNMSRETDNEYIIMKYNYKGFEESSDDDSDVDDIIEHAKILGNREQTTVTEEDLF